MRDADFISIMFLEISIRLSGSAAQNVENVSQYFGRSVPYLGLLALEGIWKPLDTRRSEVIGQNELSAV
jgi:hypothetical protein